MMVSQGKLLIDNGHVQAAALRLGHEASGNHQGYLEMKSGSLTVSTFQLMQADNKANHSNEILITGGSLEFTTENAITRYSNTESTINITGTSADAPVVLKATKVAWTLDGSGLDEAPTLGNIKVDAGNTYAITLKNVSLSGSVVNNAVLNLDGAVTAGTTGGDMKVSGNLSGSGKLVKTGAGTLELSGTNTYSGGTEVQGGTLVAKNGAALGKGNVVIKDGAVEITDGDSTVTVEKRDVDVDATINKSGAYTLNNGNVAQSNDSISILNSRITVESANDVTITHRIGGEQEKNKGNGDYASALVNNGAGTVTTTNGYNNYSALEALVGDINVQWSTTNFQGNLEKLLMEADRIIGVHTDNGAIDSVLGANAKANLATITVTETAVFGNKSQLYANLELQSGATLSLGSNVVVEGTLTLGHDMKLTGAQLEEIQALKERVELFHNVDQLKLTDALARSGAAVDYTGVQDLSNFFSNVDNGVYLLEFDQNVVYATLIPEPTTTTLSLLALAALAARRRRR